MLILAFQNALDLAAELQELGEVRQVEERVFPDGEVLARIPSAAETVVLVARLYPSVNENLVKLFLALDTLNDLATRRIVLAIPYMPYMRQDRRFREGEPISAKTVFKIMSSFGVSALVTVDLHKQYVAEYAPRVVVKNVFPVEEFAKAVGGADVVVSPDFGSFHRAEALAKTLGSRYTYFEKFRDRSTGTITLTPRTDVELRGARVVLVDDILSTGGTLVEACKACRTLGASEVVAAVSHCQLLKDARERVRSCVDRLVCTDSILNEYAEVKLGPVFKKHLSEIL
ncbi:MAG: ribose-phosphate diphosphokinase [Pyrobaculum sp.]